MGEIKLITPIVSDSTQRFHVPETSANSIPRRIANPFAIATLKMLIHLPNCSSYNQTFIVLDDGSKDSRTIIKEQGHICIEFETSRRRSPPFGNRGLDKLLGTMSVAWKFERKFFNQETTSSAGIKV
ncbi:hypothetical protein ACOSP7_026601 [Xanthoceras sorbifolium]